MTQTYSSFELIVIDDSSTDESVEVVEAAAQADPRVKLIRMTKNAGAPAAPRNAGIAAARGEWVAFLDADDVWHPRKLELQIETLRACGALMCSTQMKDFRDGDPIVFEPPPVPLPISRVTLAQQLLKYRTPTSSIVANREFMRRHLFNEDPSYKAREDTDCFIRVHEDMPFSIKIVHPLVFYRQQASQISRNKWKMVGRHLAMLKKYRLKSGKDLGAMAYVYTFTHFFVSIYLRLVRRML
ncbi:teichuronic acid biosynthesis glycosyltransferase TuaG [Variovorax soli]|uniref:Teichuronic acid biosynthesis glycosyltransferase TuaG n=1 Tax=Variovorax soli TaxID=376815 RepID=A0ABU1N8F1_9BURK|nr:teichuronic acid biosynthesis glycosyltransferase TuaG [Variovorax soli]